MTVDGASRGRLRELAFRSALTVGLTETNLVMLRTVHRPNLVYRYRGRIPGATLEWREPQAVEESDIPLCERLIAAYALSRKRDSREAGTSGVWAHLVDAHHRELMLALERGDPKALAHLLATMFRQDFVFGMAHGSGVLHIDSPLGSRIFAMKWLSSIMSLAEAIGMIPIENPEQGFVGHLNVKERETIAKLVADLELALGVEMSFPEVGAAFGMAVDGRLIPLEMLEHLYTVMRLREAISRHLQERDEPSLRVVEIGAGYGGLGYWLLRRLPGLARYTIVDLPTVNVLQGYFLSKTLGSAKVSFLGEPISQVVVLSASALADVEVPCDIVLNKDSMPEMPPEALDEYLRWISLSCSGFFYSYNHEAEAPFGEYSQRSVAAAAARIDDLHRIGRELSWARHGYVEEIYTTNAAGPS